MKRIDRILAHPRFVALTAQIAAREACRIYCRHDLAHFLDVARIASLIAADERLPISRESIYAAALVHDLGRACEEDDHAEAGARIARELLPACGFTAEETAEIASVVATHRGGGMVDSGGDFGALLRRADRLARNCFACAARATCYWTRKNDGILY